MKKTKIAFQGEHGAFSEEALIKFVNKGTHKLSLENTLTVPCKSFEDVFEFVLSDTDHLGIIPIENSHAGNINDNLDLLMEHEIYAIGEIYLDVRHQLIGLKNSSLSKITRCYSHPQALAQCHSFLQNNTILEIDKHDTAGSVRLIKEENNINTAAIGSCYAAEFYELKILKKDIHTMQDNTTRFFVVRKRKSSPESLKKISDAKTSIIFIARHIPSSLYKCLGGFATNHVNLTKIDSRPLRHKRFKYSFFLEFEGNILDKNVQHALEELDFFTSFVKILGCYNKEKK